MTKFTSRGVSGSFKTLFTVVLVVLVARFADARVGSSKRVAEQSGTLTYSGTVLHTFAGSPDGGVPYGGLVADNSGNLYGTTTSGGTSAPGEGAVFELTPDGNGGWTYNEIYSELGGIAIGIDSQRNLYFSVGIASGGIIELSPGGPGGTWVATRSYGFTGTYDGSDPNQVIVDANGIVYGTALNGGAYGAGTVFELIPVGENQWEEQTLHTFTGAGDGAYPQGSLFMDRAGDLYGATAIGGTGPYGGGGVVFKLHPTANGWKETVLYNFQGAPNDGAGPNGNLVFDRKGNLYGTTYAGFGTGAGQNGPGGVYKLTPSGQITWLHVFTGGADGGRPQSGLGIDQEGNLYGTTSWGGDTTSQYCSVGCGVIFELTPSQSNGTWSENVLHSFTGGSDGDNSESGMATPFLDQAGNMYVTSANGGDAYGGAGDGTVFELKPNPDPTTVIITKNAPSPSATGQLVTVSFTVSQSVNVGSKPTGAVTVNASTGEACAVPLHANGKGSCQLLFLSAGTRTLTATYSGDAKDQSSVSTGVTESIVNPTTTVITKIGPDPARVGHKVLVDFTVEANGAAKHTKPTGGATVNASTGESCTETISAGGTGRCELTFSTVGSRTLTATYAGDDDNEGSISIAVAETVE